MLKKVFLILFLISFFCGESLFAFWFGNPAQLVDTNQTSFGLVADASTRKIVRLSREFPALNLDSQRLVVQGNYGVSPYIQLFGRLMPGTGRLHFEHTSFNPHLWGMGLGLQLCSPQISDSVRLGLVATWDGIGGAQKSNSDEFRRMFDYFFGKRNNYVTWREAALALGASWAASNKFNVYGGLSYIRSRIDLHFENLDNQRFDNDKTVGAFAGVDYSISDKWEVGSEFHVRNETSLSAVVRYRFKSAS